MSTAEKPAVSRDTQEVHNNQVQSFDATSQSTAPVILSGDVEPVNSHHGAIDPPMVTQTPEEKRTARVYRWKLVAGLLLPTILEALDTTIVAAALTFIASGFNGLAQVSWIANAFNITACAFVPAFGQLSDLFGRYNTLQACQLIVLLGSALAAGAQDMVMLLFGRALQGVGCAGILVSIRVILADRVSLAENSKNTSIYSIVAGCAYGVAPVAGGYLTEVSWRWVFILNAPMGVAGVVAVWWLLRKVLVGPKEDVAVENETQKQPKNLFLRKVSQLDVGGQLLFLSGTTLFILAIVWGGVSYPWGSAGVLVPLLMGTVLLLSFPVYEYYMTPGRALAKFFPRQTAMIPYRVIATRNVGLLCFVNFSTGMAMYAVLFFGGVYFTIVRGFTSSESGIRILFYLPGLGVGAFIAMHLCMARPRNTFAPLFLGSIIEAIGISILIYAFHANSLPLIYAMMAITGVGTGMRFMPGTLHGVGFFPETVAPVISLLEFMIYFGGTLALPLMNSVFNNKLSVPGSSIHFDPHVGSLESIASMPTDAQEALRARAGEAIMWAFVAICPIMWLAVIVAGCLGTVYLDKGGQVLRAEGEGGDAIRCKKGVVEGFYLVDLWKRYCPWRKRPAETL